MNNVILSLSIAANSSFNGRNVADHEQESDSGDEDDSDDDYNAIIVELMLMQINLILKTC